MHAVLPNARDGFEVFDLQTGTVLTSRHADRQFAAMSVVKLLIALDALARNNWVTPDGDTLITPQDMVTGYRYLTDQVPGPDRDLLLGARRCPADRLGRLQAVLRHSGWLAAHHLGDQAGLGHQRLPGGDGEHRPGRE